MCSRYRLHHNQGFVVLTSYHGLDSLESPSLFTPNVFRQIRYLRLQPRHSQNRMLGKICSATLLNEILCFLQIVLCQFPP